MEKENILLPAIPIIKTNPLRFKGYSIKVRLKGKFISNLVLGTPLKALSIEIKLLAMVNFNIQMG